MIHVVGKNLVMYKVKKKNFSMCHPTCLWKQLLLFACLSKYFSMYISKRHILVIEGHCSTW